MTDDLDRLLMREAGGGGGGRKRRRGQPPSRPVLVAHPCTNWTDAHVQKHLRAFRRAHDAEGQWDFDPDDADEVWCYLWESMGTRRPDGVIDFGPWQVREIEV